MKDALTVPAVPIPLRDYFAAMAMKSLLLHPQFLDDNEENVAKYAYRQADAMLAHRSIPPKDGAKS